MCSGSDVRLLLPRTYRAVIRFLWAKYLSAVGFHHQVVEACGDGAVTVRHAA
jgi:hypothetical protein